MNKPITVALLISLVCLSVHADEVRQPSDPFEPQPVPRGQSFSKYQADRALTVVAPTQVAAPQPPKLAAENAQPQFHFKLIVADVTEANLAEVENVIGSLKAVWQKPSIDNATIEDLKSRKLINVISQPVLGTTAGGAVTLSFDRTDLGLPATPEEHYEFRLAADLKELDIITNVKLTITYGSGPQTRRQVVDTGFKLRPGQIVALPVTAYTANSDESERLHKVIFLSAGIRNAPAAFSEAQLPRPKAAESPRRLQIPNARRNTMMIPNSRKDATMIPNIVRGEM